MIALSLPEIKDFMNKLLCTDTFGHFLLKEAVISGSVTWSLDGTIQPDFYSSDEADALSTHSSFTPEDITGMFINLKFQQKKLLLTTGISYRIFSVDKSLDQEWDSLVKRFLTAHEISFEEL